MPRWGEIIRKPDGGVVFIDGSGPRVRRCAICGEKTATLQCDWPMPGGRTCDKYICRRCGVSVGRNRDYCPDHPQGQQGRLDM